jgi:DNA-binding XRE family transcriptional regulator
LEDFLEEKIEENLVKKTCRELGITQKELAEKIGVKPESLNSSLSRGKISNQVIKSIEMLIEIKILKNKLSDCNKSESTIKNLFIESIKQ